MTGLPRIILIGLRCSGKTTVAQLLAARRGCKAIDLDALALRRTGQNSISDVFRNLGEPAWREVEAAALDDVLSRDFSVLSLGGGTPMIESAGRALRDARRLSNCCILYLRAQPQTLVGRMTRADGDRPPLTGAAPDKEMEEMFSRRDAHFQLLADRVIETDALSPEQIADQIERELWPSREPGERGRPSNSG